jgi:uncharacterized protein YndB with AHSA1/START domain
MIKSAIQVDAAREQVFSALTDFARYSQWVPSCEECRIVRTNGNAVEVELTFNSFRRIKLGLRFESEPVHLIRFQLTQSEQIKGYSGTYRLMDSADRKGTVVITELEINGGFFAPRYVVDSVARKTVQETGEALNVWLRKMEPAHRPAVAVSRAGAGKRRDKRIARVIGTPAGYEVQIFGRNFFVGHGE